MSVLIKGMEMPTTCEDCPCFYPEYNECNAIVGRWEDGKGTPPDDCPIEVPPATDVTDRNVGEWEEVRHDEADGYYILYRCPHCGCERPKRDNYCKDCGAKMDGGQDDV